MAGLLLSSAKTEPEFNSLFSFKRLLLCCVEPKSDEEPSVIIHEVDHQDGAGDANEEVLSIKSAAHSDITINDVKDIKLDVTNDIKVPLKIENDPGIVLEEVLSVPERVLSEIAEPKSVISEPPICLKEDPFINDPDEFGDEIDHITEEDIKIAEANVIPPPSVDIKKERRKTGEIRIRISFRDNIASNSKSKKSTKQNDKEESARQGVLVTKIVDAVDLDRPSSTTSSVKELKLEEKPAILAYSLHTAIMPGPKLRHKTKMRQGPDPYFDEVMKSPKSTLMDIRTWSLRFRLYGSMRNSMKTIIGEGYLPLDTIEIENRCQCKIALLEQDSTNSELTTSTLMFASPCLYESMTSLDSIDTILTKSASILELNDDPEVLIGLMYNYNTGRLTVEVLKGTKFPKIKEKLPDTFIKVALINNHGEELESSKTTVRKSTQDPVFDETFVYQVMAYQLDDVTILISGFTKGMMGRKTLIGQFKLGSKAESDEEKLHWHDLCKAKQSDQVCRWHTLRLPNIDEEFDKKSQK